MNVLCSCVRIYLGSPKWSVCLHAFSLAGNSISYLISSDTMQQAGFVCLLPFIIFCFRFSCRSLHFFFYF